MSLSLSETYQMALMGAGAIPLTMPATASRQVIAECVRRSDGVLLPGGEDVNPAALRGPLPAKLRRTVTLTSDGGARDLREVLLVDEVFRQHKPLLAICRGHQVLNVALGGTLVVDVAARFRGHQSSASGQEERDRPCCAVDRGFTHRQDNRQTDAGREQHASSGGGSSGRAAECDRAQRRWAGGNHAVETGRRAFAAVPVERAVSSERLVDRYPAHRAIFRAFTQACAANRRNTL